MYQKFNTLTQDMIMKIKQGIVNNPEFESLDRQFQTAVLSKHNLTMEQLDQILVS
jgi:hypothetical protein